MSSNSVNQTIGKKQASYQYWLLAFLLFVLVIGSTLYMIPNSSLMPSVRTFEQGLGNIASQTFLKLRNYLTQTYANCSLYCHKWWKDLDKSSPAVVVQEKNSLQTTMQTIDLLSRQAQAKKDASLYNRLGILYAQLGDFSAAAKQFTQAIGLCRSQLHSTKSIKDPSNLYVELSCAHSNLARIYDKLGEHDRVIAELEQLNTDIAFAGDVPHFRPLNITKKTLSQPPSSHTAMEKLTSAEAASLARAEALRQVGRLSEASQEYAKLIRLNPNLAVAHQRLGLVAAMSNDLWLSINELKIAAQLDPKDPDTQNDLGLVYWQIGDYNAAKQSLSRAHLLDPKLLNASINLSNFLNASGKPQLALTIMKKAVADHPLSASAHNNLAALYARSGKNAEAAKEFSKAISLNPALASSHYGLGLALLNLKSYPAAEREFKVAMSLNPNILDLQNKIEFASRCSAGQLDFPLFIPE